jgi:hypothetical protein
MNQNSNYRFFETFDNVISNEDCKKIINHFLLVKNLNLTHARSEEADSPLKTKKDTENYIISTLSLSDVISVKHKELISTDLWIYNTFLKAIQNTFFDYSKKYNILQDLKVSISSVIKIQRTIPGQGYHVWHCERGTTNHRSRLMLVILYLNDVEHGGETEFLYQGIRISPKQGRLIFCPGDFTHTH